jgi:hypothetical protein
MAGHEQDDRDKYWPMILRCDPPIVMTREQAYSAVPHLRVTHIPATHPREEDYVPWKQSANS